MIKYYSEYTDPSFKYSALELTEAFKNKGFATYDEAVKLVKDSSIQSYFIVDTQQTETSFWGRAFFFKNGRPYKIAKAEIFTNFLGTLREAFDKWYQDQVVKLGDEVDPVRVRSSNQDEAIITYSVIDIYTAHDWDNELAIRSAELDWLEPPEDVFGDYEDWIAHDEDCD